MKNIVIILLLVVTVFCSCDDKLNLDPENSVTFLNYFNTDADLQAVMININTEYREARNLSSIYPAIQGVKTDKARGFEGYMDLSPATISADNGVSSWVYYYEVITWCNILLENIEKAEISKDRKDFYYGAGYFYRALAYFNLTEIWRDVPIITKSDFIGAIAKSDWKTVIDFAIEDCEKAEELLKPFSETVDVNGREFVTKQIASKGAANALLAHMYAWKGSLANDMEAIDKAIAAATKVIDSPEYSLALDPEEVVTEVYSQLHDETIFEIYLDKIELGSEMTPYSHFEFLFQGWPHDPTAREGNYAFKSFGLKNETVEEMYKPGDLRRDAYFYDFENQKNNPLLEGWAVMQIQRNAIISDKWGYDAFEAWDNNIVVYRLAGIILLRAECYAKKGSDGLAIADLNRVRGRSNAPAYEASEGDLYKAVFLEREKELLAQRQRWFDCIRTGFWKTELSDRIGMISQEEFDQGALFYPVFYFNMENNPLMRQNVYWLGKE